LRHAHGRRTAAARQPRRRSTPGGSARPWRAGGRLMHGGVPVTFHRRAEDALANAQLNDTLRRVTARILDSRAAGLARLPDADAWRDRGREIRAHTLAHLDRYLDQFVDSVEARGGHVHFAATAEDAVS